jgi:hypothetical protein
MDWGIENFASLREDWNLDDCNSREEAIRHVLPERETVVAQKEGSCVVIVVSIYSSDSRVALIADDEEGEFMDDKEEWVASKLQDFLYFTYHFYAVDYLRDTDSPQWTTGNRTEIALELLSNFHEI